MAQTIDKRQTTNAVQTPSIDTTTGANAAAATITKSAQMAQPLWDRLSSFSSKAVDIGTKEMVSNAKKQAVIDLESGEVDDDGLSTFGLMDSGSVYAQAYNGSAETAYISQTNTDTKTEVTRIAAQNYMNPEGFKTSWNSYKAGIKKGANKVSPYVDAVTADVADQYGDAAYSKISGVLAKKQYDLTLKDNNEALAMYDNEFIQAKLSGNEDAIKTALINRNKTIDSMKSYMQISERGAIASNLSLKKRLITAQVKSNFDSSVEDGTELDYIQDFKKMTKDNKAFELFNDTEVDAMVSQMHKSVKEQNSFEADIVKAEKAEWDAINKEVTTAFDDAELAGTLDQEHIDTALKEDVITTTEHDFYSKKIHDTGAAYTNSGTELKVVQNLGSLTKEDIRAIHDMTDADKIAYIQKLRTYQDSESGKWTSTVQGRAAMNLLKNKYNIVGANMLSELTKEEDIADYGKLYQSFVLEMEKLPPEQRESRAMHYAQAAIDVQEAAKIESETTGSNNTVETQRKNLEKRMEAYQRKIGKVKTPSYVKGLAEFQDDFGVTGDIYFGKIKEWE